eukprot:tig00020830_g14488.t1
MKVPAPSSPLDGADPKELMKHADHFWRFLDELAEKPEEYKKFMETQYKEFQASGGFGKNPPPFMPPGMGKSGAPGATPPAPGGKLPEVFIPTPSRSTPPAPPQQQQSAASASSSSQISASDADGGLESLRTSRAPAKPPPRIEEIGSAPGTAKVPEHTLELREDGGRRRYVLTVRMPDEPSMKDVELDVSEREVEVQSARYTLKVPLKEPVDIDESESRFVKSQAELVVTMPLLP